MPESDLTKLDPGSGQIIETRLYFGHEMGWQLICTFIPGNANADVGSQFAAIGMSGVTHEAREVPESLRDAVRILFDLELKRGDPHAARTEKAVTAWLEGLDGDDGLLLDDSVIVHRSPPEFEPLAKLLKSSPVAAIVAYQMHVGGTPIEAFAWVVTFGGCRIFIRLVGGFEASLGDLFDRVRRLTLPNFNPKRSTTIFVDSATINHTSGEIPSENTTPRRRRNSVNIM